jgi:ribosomal peptide maturation radical SAM protein 1
MSDATARTEPRLDVDAAVAAVASSVQPADALLIVPPFHDLNRPSLGVHILQACAHAAGLRVSVLYANLSFGALVGEHVYNSFGDFTSSLSGERLFAPAAYGIPSAARTPGPSANGQSPVPGRGLSNLTDLADLQQLAEVWADAVADAVARLDVRVVGCTSMFQQTSTSVALLDRIKRLRPDLTTIIGGANCENEMAEGIAGLSPSIDVVFSGESETSFVATLRQILAGACPLRIVYGEACRDLDAVPTPTYAEYFEQLARTMPDSEAASSTVLPAESSRGCWWGQKHQCTFCGLNGSTIAFREKSPDRVIEELRTLVDTHPTRSLTMADNIMPYTYFRTLIPRLPDEVPDVSIFYEQKANLSLEKVVALRRAGVTSIQPGIEALSTCLLRRMDKGVTAAQNVALLRYARAVKMGVAWNLLAGFPGDHLDDYEETLRLVPLLRHLHPPSGVSPVSIERFSPYFERPGQYGITNIRPIEAYVRVFPPHADLGRLAYHFDADFASEAREHPEVIQELRDEVTAWRSSWLEGTGRLPMLQVRRLSPDAYVLHDTRGLPGTAETQLLNRAEATVALVGHYRLGGPELAQAIERRLVVELDGAFVPLATADAELLLELESSARATRPVATPLPIVSAAPRPAFVPIELRIGAHA